MSDSNFRAMNFSAGPSTLPLEVLETARDELLNFGGTGTSVMEMSHRSAAFQSIIDEAERDCRELLNVPVENYSVLFLQGGATSQFAAVPMNFLGDAESADYIVTGGWSDKAAKEAQKYGGVSIVCSTKDGAFTDFPEQSQWQDKLNPNAAYLWYCANETVHGVKSAFVPVPPPGVPLVCDISSSFMSEPIDVSKFGVIIAGAQKNIAPAGLTIVIVRNDLLDRVKKPFTPVLFDYKLLASKQSMYNTPPCWCIYVAGLTFKWMKRRGGLAAIGKTNADKAALIYDAIDHSNGFYSCPVAVPARSLMNVRFRVQSDADLEAKFVSEATAKNMLNLKGHRSLGGIRASIYNAQSVENCRALVEFMTQFRKANQK